MHGEWQVLKTHNIMFVQSVTDSRVSRGESPLCIFVSSAIVFGSVPFVLIARSFSTVYALGQVSRSSSENIVAHIGSFFTPKLLITIGPFIYYCSCCARLVLAVTMCRATTLVVIFAACSCFLFLAPATFSVILVTAYSIPVFHFPTRIAFALSIIRACFPIVIEVLTFAIVTDA